MDNKINKEEELVYGFPKEQVKKMNIRPMHDKTFRVNISISNWQEYRVDDDNPFKAVDRALLLTLMAHWYRNPEVSQEWKDEFNKRYDDYEKKYKESIYA